MEVTDILDGLNVEAPTLDGYYSLKKFFENNVSSRPVGLGARKPTLGDWADAHIKNYRAPAGSIWRSPKHGREVFVTRRGLEEVVRIARTETETHGATRDPSKGGDWAPIAWVTRQIQNIRDLFESLNPRVNALEDAVAGAIDDQTLTNRLERVTNPIYQKTESMEATLAAQAQLIQTLLADVAELKKGRGGRGWF